MANAPLGTNFIDGALGVVNVEFNSVDLGKTTAETTIEIVEDVFDILYQQNGTQPYDKIPTGQAYQVTATFGEISTTLLSSLVRGITKSSVSEKSMKMDRDLYRSGRDSFAEQLRLKRVDSAGDSSTDPFYWMTFYTAMPLLSGGTINFGADSQKQIEITFYCFYDTSNSAFGYSGYASSVGL